MGAGDPPAWLRAEALLAQFGDRRDIAVERYIAFVRTGVSAESIWRHLNRQVFLGDDGFVPRVQAQGDARPDDLNVPRTQRRPPPLPLADIAAAHDSRDAAMRAACASGGYSYREIGNYFGEHLRTVERAVRQRGSGGTPWVRCYDEGPDPVPF